MKIRDVENNNQTSEWSNPSQYEGNLYHRDSYIAMERLKPIASFNYLISAKNQAHLHRTDQAAQIRKTEITNELGIYGVVVR